MPPSATEPAIPLIWEQLDAQRGLLGAELALAQIRADRLAPATQLDQALGAGWKV